MKARVVSEDRVLVALLRECAGSLLEVSAHQGASLGGAQPDVLIVDCRTAPDAMWAGVERALAAQPALAVVLIADTPAPEFLLQALRLGVREVVSGEPAAASELRLALERVVQRAQGAARAPGQVAAFIACKGGSGASFLAANLGYALAQQGRGRVLLIDLDLHSGDCALYVSEARAAAGLSELAREIARIDLSLMNSALIEVLPNFRVLPASEELGAAGQIEPAQIEALIRFARGHFDQVLLDLGRGASPLALRALELADRIHPVLLMTVPALRDARRLFEVFRRAGFSAEKVRPIVNRASRGAASVSEAEAARWLHYAIDARVPNDYPAVAASINQGVPILALAPASPVSRSLRELAARMGGVPQAPRSRGWSNWWARFGSSGEVAHAG